MELSVLKTMLELAEGPAFAVLDGKLALCTPESQALGLADGQAAEGLLAASALPAPGEAAAETEITLRDRLWILRAVNVDGCVLCTLRSGMRQAPPPNEATLLYVAGSIRQALQDLYTALDGLAQTERDAAQAHNAALAMRSVYRLRRTAEDLELFSRLRTGAYRAACEHWELVSAVDRFCRETAELLRSGGLTLRWKLPEHELTAMLDWPLTAALLRELLVNAAAHSVDGQIWLELSRTAEQRVSFSVRNRSDGGKPASIIFDRYAEDERADLEGGLGLGLSLVSQGAACQGGALLLSAEAGGETAAVLTLPVGEDTPHTRSSVQAPETVQDVGLTAFSPILPPAAYEPDWL